MQLKTFQLGERMVDRLEFEELALKSFDPSMGPSITQLKRSPVLDKKKPTIVSSELGLVHCRHNLVLTAVIDSSHISPVTAIAFDSVIRAGCIYGPPYAAASTWILLLDGGCSFYRAFHAYSWVINMSIQFQNSTIPLIAIVPNLPFFFCAWRSWSHYRGM